MTVALDAEKIQRLTSGLNLIHFRFRPLQLKYLKYDASLDKALRIRFSGNLSLCRQIYTRPPGPEPH